MEAVVDTTGSSSVASQGFGRAALSDQCTFASVFSRHPAELFAEQMLSIDDFSNDAISSLCELLPHEASSRQSATGSAFGTGCWIQGSRWGLRRNNRLFPFVTRVLNAVVRQTASDHVWTSVVVFFNVQTAKHRDANNGPEPNLLVPVGTFSGGQVFVLDGTGQDSAVFDGVEYKGRLLDPFCQPCFLPARDFEHFTLPWAGHRVMIVAFSIAPSGVLGMEDARQLSCLGFELPARLLRETGVPAPVADVSNPLGPVALELFADPPLVTAALRARHVHAVAFHHRPRGGRVPVCRLDPKVALQADLLLDRLSRRQAALLFAIVPPPGGKSDDLGTFVLRAIRACLQVRLPFCVGMPSRSRRWASSEWLHLRACCGCFEVDLCMWGAERVLSVTFLHNVPAFASLSRRCDNSHTHLPWSRDEPPAQVTRFLPSGFCDAFAEVALPFLHSAIADLPLRVASAATEGSFRPSKFPPLVPEFRAVYRIRVPSPVELPAKVPPDGLPGFPHVASGSVLLSGGRALSAAVHQLRGGEAPEQQREELQQPDVLCPGEHSAMVEPRRVVYYALPWNVQGFVDAALQCKHPCDTFACSDTAIKETVDWIASSSPSEVCAFRAGQLKRFLHLASGLAKEEKALHASLHPEVRAVLRGKRVLLFQALLHEAGIQDKHLVKEMLNGFSLVGEVPASGQFPPLYTPASISPEELRLLAPWVRGRLNAQRGGRDVQVEQSVADEASLQASDGSGWLLGPFSEEELDRFFPDGWVPSRRFGIDQGRKVRGIADLSASMVNSSCGTNDKLTLQDIDVIVDIARAFGHAVARFAPTSLQGISGRAMDLKSAYKQLAIDPAHGWAAILAVWNPKLERFEYYRFTTLPFGSIHAVGAFNRVAKGVRQILVKVFRLVVSNFYDDFCHLELDCLVETSHELALAVMQLLGWSVANDEHKALPFAKLFTILGVQLDLNEACRGLLRVANKEGRVAAILELVEKICQEGTLHPGLLAKLRGRMMYASSHTFGRVAVLATRVLSRKLAIGGPVKLTRKEIDVIRGAADLLARSEAREVCFLQPECPVLVFTDGACESKSLLTTHGAVLIDPLQQVKKFFGEPVPEPLLDRWRQGGKTQLVGQAEALPVLAAKTLWRLLLVHRKVLWFLDNESAKAAFASGSSAVDDTFEIVSHSLVLDQELKAYNWYSRVPSCANISDAASRLAFEQYDDSFRREHLDWTCEPLASLLEGRDAIAQHVKGL